MAGDIRIKDVPELRARFKAASGEQDMTYEEFLDKLLVFYEENKLQFEQASLTRERRRRR